MPDLRTSTTPHIVTGLLADVGPAVITYYALRDGIGTSSLTANLWAALVASVQTVVSAVRGGRLNAFSALMLVVFAGGVIATLTTGDVRLAIAKDALITSGVGLLFLVSQAVGRPLTLDASKKWSGDGAAELQRAYDTDPEVRHGYKVATLVWGLALLGEGLLHVVLTYTLPVDVMVGLGNVMWIATVVLLVLWMNWSQKRDEKASAARAASTAPTTAPTTAPAPGVAGGAGEPATT
ncbi:hypothetical protein GCM10027047_23360 [Rhodococcus aerolatus]